MKETLGQYLRRKRESHLISLQEISESTGINTFLLSALEEDNFHLIPQPEIIVQYLKRYAAFLNLNKNDVLRLYQTQCELHHQKEHPIPQLSLFSQGNPSFNQILGKMNLSRKRLKEVIFWSGIIVWALAIFALYHHVLSLKKEPAESPAIVLSRDVNKEVVDERRERNDVTPSTASDALKSLPTRFPDHLADRPLVMPSQRPAPLERNSGKQESGSKVQNIHPVAGKVKVIGNRETKRYHLPGMKYYNKVRLHNRIIFDSEAEAIKAGYRKYWE